MNKMNRKLHLRTEAVLERGVGVVGVAGAVGGLHIEPTKTKNTKL
jgi:hypothetical protein